MILRIILYCGIISIAAQGRYSRGLAMLDFYRATVAAPVIVSQKGTGRLIRRTFHYSGVPVSRSALPGRHNAISGQKRCPALGLGLSVSMLCLQTCNRYRTILRPPNHVS